MHDLLLRFKAPLWSLLWDRRGAVLLGSLVQRTPNCTGENRVERANWASMLMAQ